MTGREELERRVAELEREVATLRAGSRVALRFIRRRAAWTLFGLPAWDIALGPDLARGEFRGHARGFVAIGDLATGVVALGGLARGLVAFGGLAVGAFSLGGLSVGLLAALGGLAVGGTAIGGGAVGGVAIGGGAAGYYACGGGAVGTHVIDARGADPEAERYFRERGLSGLCRRR